MALICFVNNKNDSANITGEAHEQSLGSLNNINNINNISKEHFEKI
jgi:hypothetical protein